MMGIETKWEFALIAIGFFAGHGGSQHEKLTDFLQYMQKHLYVERLSVEDVQDVINGVFLKQRGSVSQLFK